MLFIAFIPYELPEGFVALLKRSKLNFTKPAVLVKTDPIENMQMNYEFALKHPRKNFEVRFAIRPMDSSLALYQREVKKGSVMVHPNKWTETVFMATMMNIAIGGESSGNMPNITAFNSAAVKNEFNADWGATCYTQLGPEFGGKVYKHCIAFTIHKDNLGDAYVFFIADEKNTILDYMKDCFHLLKFE